MIYPGGKPVIYGRIKAPFVAGRKLGYPFGESINLGIPLNQGIPFMWYPIGVSLNFHVSLLWSILFRVSYVCSILFSVMLQNS